MIKEARIHRRKTGILASFCVTVHALHDRQPDLPKNQKLCYNGDIGSEQLQIRKDRKREMTERIIRPGEFYRHFKNKLYQIIAIARHSETGERMVVYQALYGDYGVYVRPYEMFAGEVDHEKYPEVKQKWRFEQVTPGLDQEAFASVQPCRMSEGRIVGYEARQVAYERGSSYADRTPDPAFLRFLDTEDFSLRMECLKQLEERITQQELDSIYLVLDMKPEGGSLQEQIYAVRRFLLMQKRYDGSRLR